MCKKTKMWLIAAVSLIVVGCAIFGGVMTVLKWDFSKLSTAQYETNRYEQLEKFENISILADTADILLVPTESDQGAVICFEQENQKHRVAVKDGTLSITVEDTRKWYEHIGIFLETPKITVYVPRSVCGTVSLEATTGDAEIAEGFCFRDIKISVATGDVKNCASASEKIKIKTSTGGISIESVSAKEVALEVSTGKVVASSVVCAEDFLVDVQTGDVKLIDITAKNVRSSGSTGDITLKSVIATGMFSIERSTGHIKLDGADAADAVIKTNTGSVTGSFLTDKVFIAQSDTGRVKVPATNTGGKCKITTDTGNIEITTG